MGSIEDYVKFETGGGSAYIRRDSVENLRRVDSIIFDCDGVLIDVRESYDKAISKAVSYIINGLTGCSLPGEMIPEGVIFAFRRSGGFNDDWDTTYGITMYLLSHMPEGFREALKRSIKMVKPGMKPHDRFKMVAGSVRKLLNSGVVNCGEVEELVDGLEGFAENLDETGIASVDGNLLGEFRGVDGFQEFYRSLKAFFSYPGYVGESVIPTVFEELFYGDRLYREVHGVEARFVNSPGLIMNERVIVKEETLEALESIVGEGRLGIASGSQRKPADYILGDILKRFNKDALIFYDDVMRAEREALRRGQPVGNLKKPNPYSLLEAAKALEPFDSALYVGDSMGDLLMVEEARRLDARYLFAGVYRYISMGSQTLQSFIKFSSDLIVPSINELPEVLRALKGGQL